MTNGEIGTYVSHSPCMLGVENYNPGTGRFLSLDPIGFKGKDLNLFRYIFNNPIAKNDPSGQVAPVVIGAIVGGIVGGISSGYIASRGACSSFGNTALAALTGSVTGAATGVAAVISGLGWVVAGDTTAGFFAVGEGSIFWSIMSDIFGTTTTVATAIGMTPSGGPCGCNK